MSPLRDTDIEEYRLTDVDGVRVVSQHVPSVRSVSVGVWVGVGSRDEAGPTRGYAHLVEHLLFKGNARFDAAAISKWFDSIGSDANAATTKEYTVVHSRVLDRHLPATMELLGNMVLAPGIEHDDLESERQVILEEIAMYNDSPSDVVHELADLLVFEPHALGEPIVGTVETIEGAVSDAVRSFHAAHYVPARLVVSAAGSIDHDALVELVRTRFLTAAEGRGGNGAAGEPTVRTPADPHARVRARVLRKDTEQVHVVLAAPGVSRSDDRRYALSVLDTLLGSTPSSRLFDEVRERRGLAYSVYSFASHYSDTGQVGVYVAVRPDRVEETLQVVQRELERLRNEPPTDEELVRAIDHLEGRTLLSLESTTVRGNRLGASLVTNLPIEPVEETLAKIRAVTAAEVQHLANELFAPGRLVFAAVADDAEAVRDIASTAMGIDRDAFVLTEALA